ncbi:MAG: ABC transporter ATPase [Bacteroidota bacterium]
MMTKTELDIAELLPRLDDSSRVWIYQADGFLGAQEVSMIARACDQFIPAWKAHGKNLEADYRILFNRFICFFVDESGQDATGCSIDSSVHFVQELEKAVGKSLMQRTTTIYIDEEENLREVDMQNMVGTINSGTIVFNNLVTNLGEMKINWVIPARASWHARML